MRSVRFGVYPGGVAGAAGELAVGPPDVPERIVAALAALQGERARPLTVRAYEVFADGPGAAARRTPADPERYVAEGRRLDLVVQYQSSAADVDGYCRFIVDVLGRYGEALASIQVGEEPNVTGNPVLDGAYPSVTEAVAAGVIAAKANAARVGLDRLEVGINTTPLFGPAEDFLSELTAVGGPELVDALDYVGLDFFPDVFQPVPSDRLATVVPALLAQHRQHRMAPADLGGLPLRITEHGWPTGPGRSPERQAEVLAVVVGAVMDRAEDLRLDGYSHFCLRDADSSQPGPFHRFGLMTDDYRPKPAFGTYHQLIADHAG
jgi:hypothetical protein